MSDDYKCRGCGMDIKRESGNRQDRYYRDTAHEANCLFSRLGRCESLLRRTLDCVAIGGWRSEVEAYFAGGVEKQPQSHLAVLKSIPHEVIGEFLADDPGAWGVVLAIVDRHERDVERQKS